ncbi:MAG: YkgJ family cysteine cluster protein [Burkholderiales bacterium]|nr:YkgJ family cysteine cluster protein [Phycisphaerae bacterium]
MLALSDEQMEVLRQAVHTARLHPELLTRVRAVYADIQTQINIRAPRCDISGRCCRFDEFGHRLFVTTIELAAFVQEIAPVSPVTAAALPVIGAGGACVFQQNKLCTVHTIRPFGCRVFFCDPRAQEWQQDQYEAFHLRLKQLHVELSIPYLYVEWRQALKAVGLSA